MRWRLMALVSATLLSTGLAPAQQGVAQELERSADAIGFWSGGENFTTDPIVTTGPLEITLGAWCFEGIGFVRVVALDESGAEAGRVTVIGEGIESAVLDTAPGEYSLAVTVSHMHIYSWQLQAETAAQPEAPEASGSTRGAGAAPTAPEAGWVEIPYAWYGAEDLTTELFEANGDLEVTLGAWTSGVDSYVRMTAFRGDGQEVGSVTVEGEGVQRQVLSVEPGRHYLEVSSPDMDAYSWELVVQSAEEESPGGDVGGHAGSAEGAADEESDDLFDTLMAEGASVFARTCGNCHGRQGEGESGLGPRLSGNTSLASTSFLLNVVLRGYLEMPPQGPLLSDREIAAAATYVRNSWTNDFGAVTEEDVSSLR